MNRYSQYNIKETDRFDPNLFPKVRDELDPTYHIIRLLNRFKIIQIRKQLVKAMAQLPIQ